MDPLLKLAALRATLDGDPARAVRPDASIEAVWQHIAGRLKAIAESVEEDLVMLDEDNLTQRLCIELERRRGDRPYFFLREPIEKRRSGRSRRADLAAFARDRSSVTVDGARFGDGKRFLVLEAKRLPTPGTGREREYLKGDKGGIQRFKLGLHAGDLRTVGMIGYVQRRGFDHWRQTINEWIDALIESSAPGCPWDEDDKLRLEETAEPLCRLRSTSLRVTDRQRLTIRHLWVQLAREETQPRRQQRPPARQRRTRLS